MLRTADRTQILCRQLVENLRARVGTSGRGACRIALSVEGGRAVWLVWDQGLHLAGTLAGQCDTEIDVPMPVAERLRCSEGVLPFELDMMLAKCQFEGDIFAAVDLFCACLRPDPDAVRGMTAARLRNESSVRDGVRITLSSTPVHAEILDALNRGHACYIAAQPDRFPATWDQILGVWDTWQADTYAASAGTPQLRTLVDVVLAVKAGRYTGLQLGLMSNMVQLHNLPVFDLARALDPKILICPAPRQLSWAANVRATIIHLICGAGAVDLAVAPATHETQQLHGDRYPCAHPPQHYTTQLFEAGATLVVPNGWTHRIKTTAAASVFLTYKLK